MAAPFRITTASASCARAGYPKPSLLWAFRCHALPLSFACSCVLLLGLACSCMFFLPFSGPLQRLYGTRKHEMAASHTGAAGHQDHPGPHQRLRKRQFSRRRGQRVSSTLTLCLPRPGSTRDLLVLDQVCWGYIDPTYPGQKAYHVVKKSALHGPAELGNV